MIVEHFNVEPRSPEWHALRKRDLTASKVAAAAGVDPQTSGWEVWCDKAELASPPETEAMILGRLHESAVAAATREEFPDLDLDYPVARYSCFPAYRLGGTVDALGRFRSQPDELVAFEFKVITNRYAFEHLWADGPPLAAEIQLLTNIMLNGAAYGYVVGLELGKTKPVIRRVDRNLPAEARILATSVKFWQAFDEGHAPQPDYERDGDTIKAVFPPRPDVPSPVDLSADNMLPGLLERREMLMATLSNAKQEKDAIDAEVRHKLAGAERGVLPGWKISNPMVHYAEKLQPARESPRLSITRDKAA